MTAAIMPPVPAKTLPFQIRESLLKTKVIDIGDSQKIRFIGDESIVEQTQKHDQTASLTKRFHAYVQGAQDYLKLTEQTATTLKKRQINSENDLKIALQDLCLFLGPNVGHDEKTKYKALCFAESLHSANTLLNAGPICTVTQKKTANGDPIYIVEIDTPIKTFTIEQAQQYIAAVGENPPQWFKDLPLFFQDYLKTNLKDKDLANVKKFLEEKLGSFPSNIRGLPGAANHTKRRVLMLDKNLKVLIDTSSVKAATASAIGMNVKTERDDAAYYNILQILQDELQSKVDAWIAEETQHGHIVTEIEIQEKFKDIPIILQSLLSPLKFPFSLLDFAEHNEQMLAAKEAAIARICRDGGVQIRFNNNHVTVKPQLLSTNHPINNLRGSVITSSDSFGNAVSTNFLINLLEDRLLTLENEISELKKDPLKNAEILGKKLLEHTKLEKLREIRNVFYHLMGPDKADRDQNIFWSAYELILADKLGGFAVSGCKSAEDRFGMVSVYQEAILEYYTIYNRFPRPDDQGQDRDDFVDIVAHQLLRGHAACAADANARGVKAIKSLAKGLTEDVLARLEKLQPGFIEQNEIDSSRNKILLHENALSIINKFFKIFNSVIHKKPVETNSQVPTPAPIPVQISTQEQKSPIVTESKAQNRQEQKQGISQANIQTAFRKVQDFVGEKVCRLSKFGFPPKDLSQGASSKIKTISPENKQQPPPSAPTPAAPAA